MTSPHGPAQASCRSVSRLVVLTLYVSRAAHALVCGGNGRVVEPHLSLGSGLRAVQTCLCASQWNALEDEGDCGMLHVQNVIGAVTGVIHLTQDVRYEPVDLGF